MAHVADSEQPKRRWWAALALTPLLRWLVIRHAVPEGQPWRSCCPDCDSPVTPGYRSTSPMARCRCGRRLGPAPFTVEILVAVLSGLVVLAPWSPWERAGFGWWMACWAVLTYVDLMVHRLPFVLSYAAAGGLFLFLTVAALTSGDVSRLGRAAAGGAIVAALMLFGALFTSSGLVGGDVRAGLSVGIAAGWVSWFAIVSALFLSGVVMALFGIWLVIRRRATFKSPAPFGPSMFIGTLLAVLLLQDVFRQ